MPLNNLYSKIEKPIEAVSVLGSMDDYPSGFVISVDKPYRWTSADVVRKIKFRLQRYFGLKNIKVGHAGTLDPLATGILLICVGKATKVAEQLQAQSKEYIAGIRFGATTPSFDLEKEIDNHFPWEHITRELIESKLPQFLGEIDQIPPVFSAKFIDGSRAYDLARAGIETIMKPSRVTIYDLQLISFDGQELRIAVKCSKGTYIRSFARDIGEACGSGAHLVSLVRTVSGSFGVENALSMEDIEDIFKIS